MAQPLPDVAPEVKVISGDDEAGIGRPPRRPVRIAALAAHDRDGPRGDPLLVPDLVQGAEVLTGGGHRDDAAPVRAQHAGRAQVRAHRHRSVAGTGGIRGDRELERLPVRVAASRHRLPGVPAAAGPAARAGIPFP